MYRRLFLISLLGWMFFLGTIWTHAAADKTESPVYWVCVSATADGFDDPKSLRAGFGDFEGDAITYINGDPVSINRGGGVLEMVNQWIQKGPNTVTMGGNHQRPLYVKVASPKSVVGKAVFRHDAKPDPAVIEFQADAVADLPQRDILLEDEASRTQCAKEIRAWLDRFKGAIAAHNRAELTKFVRPGCEVMARAYPDRKAEIEELPSQCAEIYSDAAITVEADAMPNLQMVFGRRCVLVYCNEGTGLGSEYAMKVHKGKELLRMPPMCFVRVHGEWIVWQ